MITYGNKSVTGIEKCSKNGNGSATKSATIVQQNR